MLLRFVPGAPVSAGLILIQCGHRRYLTEASSPEHDVNSRTRIVQHYESWSDAGERRLFRRFSARSGCGSFRFDAHKVRTEHVSIRSCRKPSSNH